MQAGTQHTPIELLSLFITTPLADHWGKGGYSGVPWFFHNAEPVLMSYLLSDTEKRGGHSVARDPGDRTFLHRV